MKNLVVLCCVLLSLCVPSAADNYRFDAQQSSVTFDIDYLAGTAHGTFEKFEGVLEFDKARPEDSKVSVKIFVDSVDTGSEKRDRHLQEEDYFHASKHPAVTFESKSFRDRGEGQYVVAGVLSIRGVSKPITLQAKLADRQAQWAVPGDALVFESQYELDRTEFGVSGGRPGVSDRLKIALKIKAFLSK